MPQQPQAHVVERHVAQVRTGVGEAHLDTGFARQLLEHVGPMVGDGGAPSQRRAVFEHQIQEGVDGVQPAPVQSDLTEGLPDHRRVGAVDDIGVEEVALPHPHAELTVVILTEPAAIRLVTQQLVALDLVTQMQCRRARTELLEDHQVDTVRVDLERHRQVLPAEVAAEAVHQACGGPHHLDGEGVGLDVCGRQQAGLEGIAEDAQRLGHLRAEVERVLDVGSRLQDPARTPQHGLEPTQFTRLGIGRGQRAGPADLTVELVEKQLLRGHSDEAGLAAPRPATAPSGPVRFVSAAASSGSRDPAPSSRRACRSAR